MPAPKDPVKYAEFVEKCKQREVKRWSIATKDDRTKHGRKISQGHDKFKENGGTYHGWSDSDRQRQRECLTQQWQNKTKSEKTEHSKKTSAGQPRGEDHPAWKGDGAGYNAKHQWLRANFPPPSYCEHCFGPAEPEELHAHNLSGTYKRERSDWQYVHVWCHKKIHPGYNE